LTERLLKIAKDAGDFVVWSQDQAGTGVVPFPAVRNGKGRPFEVAERFMRQAEKDGKLDQVVKNGWAVEDFSDGGLQFDNGLAGVWFSCSRRPRTTSTRKRQSAGRRTEVPCCASVESRGGAVVQAPA